MLKVVMKVVSWVVGLRIYTMTVNEISPVSYSPHLPCYFSLINFDFIKFLQRFCNLVLQFPVNLQ